MLVIEPPRCLGLHPKIFKILEYGNSNMEEIQGSVLFCDVCDYTRKCISDGTHKIVLILHELFDDFDKGLSTFGVTKVGTIGDAYMVICEGEIYTIRMVHFAEYILDIAQKHKVDVRIGISSGHFIKSKSNYYGETVNKASRMESNGGRNCVRISTSTKKLLMDEGYGEDFFIFCGIHEVKSYGFIHMYILKIGNWRECQERMNIIKPRLSLDGVKRGTI